VPDRPGGGIKGKSARPITLVLLTLLCNVSMGMGTGTGTGTREIVAIPKMGLVYATVLKVSKTNLIVLDP
jgi:cell division GTPase FtsZ